MRRALVAGLGLIGGSIGIALRSRGWRVAYLDPHVEPETAASRGAADERVESFDDDAIAGIDLLILATPVDVARTMLETLETNAIVTSVGSVMQPLRNAAARVRFVAGHPMAGSEERSLGAARADLFAGKAWFVDADEPLVMAMIADCGGVADVVDAGEHDRAVALTSHLPQLLSTALAASIDEASLRFAGSGLRTFLRLAGSDASVWAPVIAANREQIADHADTIAKTLRELIDDDPREAFARAQDVAKKLG